MTGLSLSYCLRFNAPLVCIVGLLTHIVESKGWDVIKVLLPELDHRLYIVSHGLLVHVFISDFFSDHLVRFRWGLLILIKVDLAHELRFPEW